MTLVELVIGISLISILMIAFSSIYITSINNYQQELTQTKLQSDGQIILDEILNDITIASSVDASYNAYSTSSQSVILNVPALASNQNFIYSGNNLVFDRIIYYQDGVNLHKLVYANSSSSRYPQNNINKILTSKITGLNFVYNPDQNMPTDIKTTFTLVKTVGHYHGKVTMAGKSRLRNNL